MEGFNANNWVLFNRDIPHALEKIFLNLDYESYKECLQVNSSWYDLLTSSSYIEKAKANWTSIILDFRKKISKDSNKLWRAARDGNVSKVRTLAPFANVNYVNRGHWAEPDTPLIQAAKMGHKMVIKILLNKGADPNKRKYDGNYSTSSGSSTPSQKQENGSRQSASRCRSRSYQRKFSSIGLLYPYLHC